MGLTFANAQTIDLINLDEDDPMGEGEGSFLDGSLLPNGSILKDVVLPSYDKELNIAGVISIKEMTIVTKRKLSATDVLIDFYNPDSTRKARIKMKDARLKISRKDPETQESQKFLYTEEPVSLISDELNVDGSGLAYDTDRNRGFLYGPVTAVSLKEIDLKTSMNAKPVRHSLTASAILMAAVLPAQAQEKPRTSAERFASMRLTPAELAKLSQDSAPQREKLKHAASSATSETEAFIADAKVATLTMNKFMKGAALTSLVAAPAPDTPGDVPGPEVDSAPDETTITAKDGAYFDSTEGLLIFLKDVKVKNPQFQLNGADDLKVFMTPKKAGGEEKETKEKGGPLPSPKIDEIEAEAGKKPKIPEPPKEITPEMGAQMLAAKAEAKKAGGGDFGDMKRIIATGVIVLDFTPDDPTKSPVKASARTVIYDFDREVVILRGGSPWIIQDGKPTRVIGDDAYIFIHLEDGDPVKFVTGNQEMFESTFKTPKDSKLGKKKTNR